MVVIDVAQFEERVRQHRLWIEQNGQGQQLVLRNCVISNIDASHQDLRYVQFIDCVFIKCDFVACNFTKAVFTGCILARRVRFVHCDLQEVNLCDANLYTCKFILCCGLETAIVDDKTLYYRPQCPMNGSFIGYKGAWCYDPELHIRPVLVTLEIPADAYRSSATTRKCRCNKAIVLDAYTLSNGQQLPDAVPIHSTYNYAFVYTIGQTLQVDDYDTNRWNECSTGIHFFMEKEDARLWIESWINDHSF